MAEILVKLETADNPADPNAWTRGDIVCIMPDGHKWGKKECPPKFQVVRVPDAKADELQGYIEPAVELGSIKDALAQGARQVALRPCKIDLAGIVISASTVSLTKRDVGQLMRRVPDAK